MKSVISASGVIYELREELGRGVTAMVYRGRPQSPNQNGEDKAVKVALSLLNRDGRQRFWEEYDLLQALAESGHTPQVEKGWFQDEEGIDEAARRPILIMDLIPNEQELLRWKSKVNETEWQSILLQSARQYAKLLTFMHAQGVTMRGDRKPADLRWDNEHQVLKVLDWNRAERWEDIRGLKGLQRQLTPATYSGNDQEQQLGRLRLHQIYEAADIRLFGRLWGEFFLETSLFDALPNIDDDEPWKNLPLGLRLILKKSFENRPYWGYQTAEALRQDLAWLSSNWSKPVQELQGALEKEKQSSSPDDSTSGRVEAGLTRPERILTLSDLARRLDLSLTNAFDKDKETYLSALEPSGRFEDSLENIERFIKRAEYQRAEAAINAALMEFNRPTPEQAVWRVPLRRLRIVAAYGQEATFKHRLRSAGDYTRKLLESVQKLERVVGPGLQAPQLNATLREVERDVEDVKLPEITHPLVHELACYQALKTSDGEGVRRAWKDLKAKDADQAHDLRRAFGDLDKALGGGDANDALQAERQNRQKALEKAWEKLTEALIKPGSSDQENGSSMAQTSPSQTPSDLAGRLQAAWEAVYQLEALRRDELASEEHKQKVFIEWLLNMEESMAHARRRAQWRLTVPERCRAWQEALERFSTLKQPDTGKFVQAASSHYLREIYDQAEGELKRTHWPDELEEVDALAQKLLDAATQKLTPYLPMKQTIANFKTETKELKETLDAGRKAIGWVSQNEQDKLWERLTGLEETESSSIEEALTQALARKIELFDGTNLTPGQQNQQNQYSVSNILAQRALRRLIKGLKQDEARLENFVKHVNNLKESDLPKLESALTILNQIETLAPRITQLENAFSMLRTLSQTMQKLTEDVEKSERSWKDLQKRVWGAHHSVPGYEADLTDALLTAPQPSPAGDDDLSAVTAGDAPSTASQASPDPTLPTALAALRTQMDQIQQLEDALKSREEDLANLRTHIQQRQASADALFNLIIASGVEAIRRLEPEEGQKMAELAFNIIAQAQNVPNKVEQAEWLRQAAQELQSAFENPDLKGKLQEWRDAQKPKPALEAVRSQLGPCLWAILSADAPAPTPAQPPEVEKHPALQQKWDRVSEGWPPDDLLNETGKAWQDGLEPELISKLGAIAERMPMTEAMKTGAEDALTTVLFYQAVRAPEAAPTANRAAPQAEASTM